MRATARPLTAGWVAGSIRARAMLSRRLGRREALRIAGGATLDDALAALASTAYGRAVRPHRDLAEAQRAVAETVLWHVRVLAGWVPPRALEPVRALAAWFELANVDERLAYLAGADARFVAFYSAANNLAPSLPRKGCDNVFVHACWEGTTTLVSVAPDGTKAAR